MKTQHSRRALAAASGPTSSTVPVYRALLVWLSSIFLPDVLASLEPPLPADEDRILIAAFATNKKARRAGHKGLLGLCSLLLSQQ